MPKTVHHNPGHEGIILVPNPLGQFTTTLSLRRIGGEPKDRGEAGLDRCDSTGRDFRAPLKRASPDQEVSHRSSSRSIGVDFLLSLSADFRTQPCYGRLPFFASCLLFRSQGRNQFRFRDNLHLRRKRDLLSRQCPVIQLSPVDPAR